MFEKISIVALNNLFQEGKEIHEILDKLFNDKKDSTMREFHFHVLNLMKKNWNEIISKKISLTSLIPELKKLIEDKIIFLRNQIKSNWNEVRDNNEREREIKEFEKILSEMNSKIKQVFEILDSNHYLKPNNSEELLILLNKQGIEISRHYFNYIKDIWDFKEGRVKQEYSNLVKYIKQKEKGSPMEEEAEKAAIYLGRCITELNKFYSEHIII